MSLRPLRLNLKYFMPKANAVRKSSMSNSKSTYEKLKFDVYVYNGLGANEHGCNQLLQALHTCLDSEKHDVIQFISPEEIINGSKLKGAALIAFGSGYTTGFASALGEIGLRNLRDYVLSGGSYLGLGAGGYFGCDFIEFDKEGPLEKLSERELRFFPGIGRGPVYPGFQYGTNKGLCATFVTFHTDTFSRSFHCMIDGGGAFYPSDPPKPGSNVKTVLNVAVFAAVPETPSAIVYTMVGAGRTVLSGVHLEYDVSSLIKSDPSLEHLQETFNASRQNQINAFKSLVQLLTLNVA
ncbi:unnamed protein product [Lymnaea stagnalis]|uniref:Biotin-protein ligase N-terminal domain-containing protein n=1 Tax=Lymnaea stagnalis TaxID=6523 RepID=A0AAV2IN84_LYMST